MGRKRESTVRVCVWGGVQGEVQRQRRSESGVWGGIVRGTSVSGTSMRDKCERGEHEGQV